MPVLSCLVRASPLAMRNREFVTAAYATGCSEPRIVLRHVSDVPGAARRSDGDRRAQAILIEATLSFLGLGSQPPEPSWGNMLSAAQGYPYRSPWYGPVPWPGSRHRGGRHQLRRR